MRKTFFSVRIIVMQCALLTFSLEHSILDIENNINVRRKAYMQDINALLETALKEAKNLKPGESFLVKDLFKGYLWNRIPRVTVFCLDLYS